MSKVAEEKNRDRKSKAKLDRLLDIKRAIMESLHILSRHDRPAGQNTKKCSTVPSLVSSGYRFCQTTEWCPLNRVDIIRQPGNSLHVIPILMDPNSQLQNSCQTWPQDVYYGKTFSEFHAETIQSQSLQSSITKGQVNFPPEKDSSKRVNLTRECMEDHTAWVNKQTLPTSVDRIHCKSQGCTEEVHSSKIYPDKAQKNQEVQTEPEVEYPWEPEHVNSDIIRYLNQINDMANIRHFQTESPRRSVCFSPRYDSYDDRFCYRYHSPPYVPHQTFYGPREYTTLPTVRDFRCDASQPCLCQRTTRNHETLEHSSPMANEKHSHNTSQTRAPSEDSGSVFSSETDSDFIFYPCTSLTDSFKSKCMTLADSRDTSFLSPPADLPENINSVLSWRSELFGSSLDDITQQFFYDDDALSDDVFVDEPAFTAGYPIQSVAQPHEDHISHCFENPLYNSPKLTSRTLWELQNLEQSVKISDEYNYMYQYADIDEALQSYNHTDGQEGAVDVDKENHVVSLSTDNPKSTSTDSSSSRGLDEHHLNVDQDLANVFDSLRRNSTQSKARRMWRQRRARAKKNLNCTKGETSQSTIVFKFVSSTGDDDSRPLRGILKNKDSEVSADNTATDATVQRLQEINADVKATDKEDESETCQDHLL